MARQKEHWKHLQFHELSDYFYLDNTKAWRKITYKNKTYFVSEDSQVYSMAVSRLLNGQIRDVNNRKYKHYNFQGQWFSAHILCMMCHGTKQPTIEHEINHKDLNSLNNHISNLEWTLHKDNIKHSFDNGRKRFKGKEHWRYGVEVSEDIRKKMSEAKQGIKHPKFKGYYIVNGIEYVTPTQASIATGLSYKTIYKRCTEGTHKPMFDFKHV